MRTPFRQCITNVIARPAVRFQWAFRKEIDRLPKVLSIAADRPHDALVVRHKRLEAEVPVRVREAQQQNRRAGVLPSTVSSGRGSEDAFSERDKRSTPLQHDRHRFAQSRASQAQNLRNNWAKRLGTRMYPAYAPVKPYTSQFPRHRRLSEALKIRDQRPLYWLMAP